MGPWAPFRHRRLVSSSAKTKSHGTLVQRFDSAILLNDFIVPLFMDHKTVNLKLSGDDVSMHLRFAHVLPIPIKRLRLEKTLSCKILGMSEAKDIPEEICHSAHVGEGRRLDSSQGYSIRCTPHSPSGAASASSEIVV